MEQAVGQRYPYPDSKPETRRDGFIPEVLMEIVEKQQEDRARRHVDAERCGSDNRRRLPAYMRQKNATPGDGARPMETCLDDVRPKAFTVDRETTASTDPGALAHGALQRYGELHIRTDTAFITQWHPKYI